MNCPLCKKEIIPGTAAVSIVGGMFPREEPDLFVVDEQVLRESYAHLPCLLKTLRGDDVRSNRSATAVDPDGRQT
jgi:hypothetical protein